ncbi:MAG: hypothetical protein M1840_000914 [Geoglossum simile]|nr:MAG: hypothetical protein M1840_000914 [Geoglossum simile]
MADPPSLNFYPKDTGLRGIEFAARCPPDVIPRTRIVAVCGITNIDDRASPTEDGWFLSDFWMFNHLFRNAPVANQIWLTCCNPRLLVEQYGRYAHGNPCQERRIVLEEQLLVAIQEAGTLRIVEPRILLERFLKTVEDECKEAVKNGQEVLLLVFGHGDGDTYGVTIGSNSNTEFKEVSAPRLRVNRLKVAVGSKARCTLLMTSCYSGGWAMKPDLNFTVITAAGSTVESQSWNASLTRGFSGSIVASAIRDAIFATEVENEGAVGMAHEELVETETYAEMGCLIHDCLKENDRFHDKHEISFAAQDDKWTMAWRKRTGIPLAFFKGKWEELSVLPAQPDGYSNRDPSSSLANSGSSASDSLRLSETRVGSTTSRTLTKTAPQIYSMVRALAAGYAQSSPGADNLSSNTAFHTKVRLLLTSEKYRDQMDDLLTLGYTLSYRLESMAMATSYKDFVGLSYPDCASCGIEAWTDPLYESNEREAKEKLSRYREARDMIHAAKIFSAASDGQGYTYLKPRDYLAIAFVESGRTKREVEQAIGALKELHTAILAPKVEAVRRGRWFLDKAGQILKPVKKTLRSLSPRKRGSVIPSDQVFSSY